jgi:hypothetical protein
VHRGGFGGALLTQDDRPRFTAGTVPDPLSLLANLQELMSAAGETSTLPLLLCKVVIFGLSFWRCVFDCLLHACSQWCRTVQELRDSPQELTINLSRLTVFIHKLTGGYLIAILSSSSAPDAEQLRRLQEVREAKVLLDKGNAPPQALFYVDLDISKSVYE